MPATYGSVTPSVALAATAASTAFPPSRSTSMAVRVASRSTLAAAPPVPTAVGVEACWAAAGAPPVAPTSASTSTPSQTSTRLRPIRLPRFPEPVCAKPDTTRGSFPRPRASRGLSTGTPWVVAASVSHRTRARGGVGTGPCCPSAPQDCYARPEVERPHQTAGLDAPRS